MTVAPPRIRDDHHDDTVAWKHLVCIESRHRGRQYALKLKPLVARIQYSVHRKMWTMQEQQPEMVHPCVVFTAIYLLMRYCCVEHVTKYKVAHVAEGCFWIACKLVRGQDLHPTLTTASGFVGVFRLRHTSSETLLLYETAILKALDYDVTTVTAYDLTVLLLRNMKRRRVVTPERAKTLLQDAVATLRKCEGRPSLLQYKPSEICAAALNDRLCCSELGMEWHQVQFIVICMS
jgi:hypothetical protein